VAQTPKGTQSVPVKPTIVYKEVCCCGADKKSNAKDLGCCSRRKGSAAGTAANCKDATTRETSEKKLQGKQ